MATIEDNLNEAMKRFEAMQITNREMEQIMHKLLSRVLSSARRTLSDAAKRAIDKDPHNAYKAIKRTVYRRILGGNVSILDRKRRSGGAMAPPTSRREALRSEKTKRMLSYPGEDRGYILRFINSGTNNRVVESFNGRTLGDVDRNPKRAYKGGIGNRGKIPANGKDSRNWFPNAGQKAMDKAAHDLAELIEKEIKILDK